MGHLWRRNLGEIFLIINHLNGNNYKHNVKLSIYSNNSTRFNRFFFGKYTTRRRNFYRGKKAASSTYALIIVKIRETPSEWFSSGVSRSALVCSVSRDTEPQKMGH